MIKDFEMERVSWIIQRNHRVLIRGKQEGQCQRGRCEDEGVRERFADVTLLTLKTNKRASSQAL